MTDEIKIQERQDVIRAAMRFFIGRKTNRIYHVVQCEYEYQSDV